MCSSDLAGITAIVEHEPVSTGSEAKLRGDVRRLEQKMAEHGVIFRSGSFQRGDGLARNDEDMRWRHGLDVPEGDDVFILEDDGGGDFLVADALEEGFAHTANHETHEADEREARICIEAQPFQAISQHFVSRNAGSYAFLSSTRGSRRK